jgi:hypothetical protein
MGYTMRADQKQARSSLIRAITSVALHPRPLRTTQAALQVQAAVAVKHFLSLHLLTPAA